MTVVDDVKDRIDLVEVVAESVKLRKSGKNYSGFCPFHPNTRTPAFVVFPDTGTWRCFGACNEGGDVFSFVMKKEGWDFPEALEVLAERAGVELAPRTPAMEAADEELAHLRELLETTVTFFRHQLLQSDTGREVQAYLRDRGLSDETLELFEIGYAPRSWDATIGYLNEKGYSEQDLIDAGVASERETGGIYDRFRHRIMIPIRDLRGRMVGFGARSVDPEDVPKFLNSPQTRLFDKGRLLYGLDKARRSIRAAGETVIVEGYFDVVALHQAGFQNVVSPMGTALSEDQLRLLKRFSRRIILALDADVAGDQATLRGLDVARQTMDREPDPVFNAQGMIRYEGRLDAEIRVVTLPPEKDPDEVVAEDPEAWPALLERSKPVVDYVLDVLVEGQDIDDAKVKAQIARQMLPLIEDVADSVEREAYRQRLARTLKVDERSLLSWRPAPAKRRTTRRKPDPTAGPPAPASQTSEARVERFCLGLLLQDPELLYRIDRELQALGLDRLAAGDFNGTERRVIFRAVKDALDQQDEEPAVWWRGHLEPSVAEIAAELAAEAGQPDMGRGKVVNTIVADFLRLRKRSLEAAQRHVEFQLLAAQEEAQDQVPQLQQQFMNLIQSWSSVDRALAQRHRQSHESLT